MAIGKIEFLIFLPLVWLLPTVLAGIVASRRGGNRTLWGAIAFVSFWFAWLVVIVAYAVNNHKLCFACRKRVDMEASICPYCRSDLRSPLLHPASR